jgi:hypothetical protein
MNIVTLCYLLHYFLNQTPKTHNVHCLEKLVLGYVRLG